MKTLPVRLIGGSLIRWSSLCLVFLLAAVCAAQTQQPVTLTFEGLQDNEPIMNYYNGGRGGNGSGPGPNYGITFGSGALAIISIEAGGTGNFDRAPSGHTVAFFLEGGGLVMNVPAGFNTGFSFYYAAPDYTGTVVVYDGLDATGNILASLSLDPNGGYCGGSNYPYSCWTPIGVSFAAGTARSVNFSGTANYIAFDDITLGSSTPDPLTITTATLPAGMVGRGYNQTIAATGGIKPYSWSATGLPGGLTINSTSGVLSGTPTQEGTFSVVVNVHDSSTQQQSVSKTLSLVISPALAITTASLPGGSVGAAYSETLGATGGTTPYTWSATGLPSGLSLSSGTGLIGGTPTQGGTFTVRVTVRDSSTPQQSASKSFSLVISTSPLTIDTSSLANGVLGVPYSQPVSASGGVPPYSWSTAGIPPGLAINSTTGLISGTPTQIGTFNVAVKVLDSSQQTVTKNFAMTVANPALAITTTALVGGSFGNPYSQPVSATGGTTPYSWSATGLPGGLAIDAGSGLISGTPSDPGAFSVNVTVQDSSSPQQTVSSSYTLTIAPPPPPTVNLTMSTVSNPTDQPTITLALANPAPASLSGTLTLTFTPNATAVPAGYIDPAVRFASGGATTLNFTIASGASSASIPNNGQFSQGTVAGTLTITMTALTLGSASILPSPAPSTSVTIASQAPAITAGSVRIINVTASGFTVEVQGYSTPRDLSQASVTFAAASGATLDGTSFTIPLTSASATWFDSNDGRNNGSRFAVDIPFTYSGDTTALGTATVTLANSAGTSAAVSGGR